MDTNGTPKKRAPRKKTARKRRAAKAHRKAKKAGTGPGGLLQDPQRVKPDLTMIETSARKRWNTKPTYKDAIASKVARVTLESEDDKVTLMGARTYATFEAQNQADELKAKPDNVNVTIGSMEDRVALVMERLKAARAGVNGK